MSAVCHPRNLRVSRTAAIHVMVRSLRSLCVRVRIQGAELNSPRKLFSDRPHGFRSYSSGACQAPPPDSAVFGWCSLFPSVDRMQPYPGLVVQIKLLWFLITLSLASEHYIIWRVTETVLWIFKIIMFTVFSYFGSKNVRTLFRVGESCPHPLWILVGSRNCLLLLKSWECQTLILPASLAAGK